MNQQQKDALTQNWDQAKEQVRSRFPDVTDDELNQARNDPSQLAAAISQRTGQPQDQVEQELTSVAQQFSNQGGQTQK